METPFLQIFAVRKRTRSNPTAVRKIEASRVSRRAVKQPSGFKEEGEENEVWWGGKRCCCCSDWQHHRVASSIGGLWPRTAKKEAGRPTLSTASTTVTSH
ncbi:hypothetical protein B566_EDAN006006 [Ephemera danica]|nr:hypothetical protein B566_EDAN006006 [Ephemera danica]